MARCPRWRHSWALETKHSTHCICIIVDDFAIKYTITYSVPSKKCTSAPRHTGLGTDTAVSPWPGITALAPAKFPCQGMSSTLYNASNMKRPFALSIPLMPGRNQPTVPKLNTPPYKILSPCSARHRQHQTCPRSPWHLFVLCSGCRLYYAGHHCHPRVPTKPRHTRHPSRPPFSR
jgi:hypothetical protein